jgi:hypothetical protein
MKFSKLHPKIFSFEVTITLAYYVLGYYWIVSVAGTEESLSSLGMIAQIVNLPWLVAFLILFPFLPFIIFAVVNHIIVAFTAKDKM